MNLCSKLDKEKVFRCLKLLEAVFKQALKIKCLNKYN